MESIKQAVCDDDDDDNKENVRSYTQLCFLILPLNKIISPPPPYLARFELVDCGSGRLRIEQQAASASMDDDDDKEEALQTRRSVVYHHLSSSNDSDEWLYHDIIML